MTDTNDRLTEIRERLDAATPTPWTRFARNASAPDEDDWYLGHDVHGPPRAQRGQIERVADAELIAHAPDDLAHLLTLVEQIQGQIDKTVLGEIADERVRQDEKWGEQNHPDGTGAAHYRLQAESYRQRCDRNHRADEGTWLDILLEEAYEASAESDPAKLRAELIQVAAVAVAWVEAIDRRGGVR